MQAVKAGQNHPYARVNLERDTSEILYEDVDIKWGYSISDLEKWMIMWFIGKVVEGGTRMC
jgi:hypothetical protein